MNKKIAIPVSLALFASVLVWWQLGSPAALGEMELKVIAGNVDVIRDGKTLSVDGVFALQPLDLVHTRSDSEARLRLAGDRNIRLAENTHARVMDGRTIETERGGLLARTTDPLRVRFGDVTASASEATWRVDQMFSAARAGVYDGSIDLTAVGQPRLSVPGLFEAPIAAGDIPTEPTPYTLEPTDAWDSTFLEDVIDLDAYLTEVARGLQRQMGPARPGLDFFRSLAGKGVPFLRPHLRRPTVDLLIGFTVARNAPAPLDAAVDDTFGYFDAGGTWGVVATIMQAQEKRITAALDRMIGDTGAVAGGTGGQADFALASASAPGASSGPGDGGVVGGTDPVDGNTTNNNDNNNDDDDPKPTECTAGTIECTTQEIEEQLPSAEPQPDPSPTGDPLDLLD